MFILIQELPYYINHNNSYETSTFDPKFSTIGFFDDINILYEKILEVDILKFKFGTFIPKFYIIEAEFNTFAFEYKYNDTYNSYNCYDQNNKNIYKHPEYYSNGKIILKKDDETYECVYGDDYSEEKQIIYEKVNDYITKKFNYFCYDSNLLISFELLNCYKKYNFPTLLLLDYEDVVKFAENIL